MLRERRRQHNFKPNRKLDRKSSRGMIYENEELRLRTININAEVERGQSDIRKLRQENAQLRREIWSLRDEYDRLDKLLHQHRADGKKDEDDQNSCSCSQSEDSESCDSCNEDDEEADSNDLETAENKENTQKALANNSKLRENLHVNFDHLSIVSEENLTNSDGNSIHQGEAIDNYPNDSILMAPKTALPETPVFPLLSDLQSVVPPLKHFENLPYDKIGPNVTDWDWPNSANCNHSGVIQNLKNISTETQIIRSNPMNSCETQKHFFSPLKSSLKQRSPPDVFVKDVLAFDRLENNHPIEPEYAVVRKNTRTNSPSLFQTGGNLEELLQDIEALSNDILQMQVQNNCLESQSGNNYPLTSSVKSTKPFRSEINLVLSYTEEANGKDKKIIDSNKSEVPSTSAQDITPPPNVPEPMLLLPPTLPYMDFANNSHYASIPEISSSASKNENKTQSVTEVPLAAPFPHSDKCISIPESKSLPENVNKVQSPAMIRRRLFARKSPAESIGAEKKGSIDKMNDKEKNKNVVESTEPSKNSLQRIESQSSSSERNVADTIKTNPPSSEQKRKSRRVSIYFNGKKTDEKDKETAPTENNKSSTIPVKSNRRSSVDVSSISTNSIAPAKHHHHRKPSQESVKIARENSKSNKKRSHRISDNSTHNTFLTHDIYGEPTTSLSERNSASLASSRESSTSLSMRSQKSRRISINSQAGGKIPWCGCWGNGCI